MTGQSNSLGTTNGSEPDLSPGVDAADARVQFYWHNVANVSTSIGDSGGVFTTLQEQQGGYYPRSATHWGPEFNCARTLYRSGVRDVGIIKASRGGGGNINWSKADGGHMYTHVTSTVAQAAADLVANGHTFEVVGLMYLQGESDSGAEAALASNRLSLLIANLRTDLPNASGMVAVIGGIALSGATRDVVRAQQAALAAGDASVTYFSNLDLQAEVTDGLHFNKAAKLTIGKRYADAFIQAGAFSRDYGDLVFIGDSITQGGNGQPSYRYEVFSKLAQNNAAFTFVGSGTGAYQLSAVSTPDVNGQSFSNVHDGHFGWRAFWENGRVPIPTSRHSNNRGEGTIRNWTGQTNRYESGSVGNWVSYPVPFAGSGNTGTTYTQDTAFIMIGINDMGDGSSTNQILADVALMVDQLQAANSNSTIFLTTITYVGSGHALYPAFNTTVDDYNALLSLDAPGWSDGPSAVMVIDVTTDFDADTMTYDNVHPNSAGETHVGQAIAAGMGMIVTNAATSIALETKSSGDFAHRFGGHEIWNGTIYTNGWADVGAITEFLTNEIFSAGNPGAGGAWVEGTAASADGGSTDWNQGNDGDWTIELRLKFDANPAGFIMWLGTDADLILVEVYADRTQDEGGGAFNVAHDNVDGLFHRFRITHDSAEQAYHVWRDGAQLTPEAGAAYDSASNDSRLILGDYTSGGFGNGFEVDIDYVRFDHSGAYAPVRVLDGSLIIVH
ncbi:MAG: hypothetical protein ACI9OU_001410 [Candidatus Promineifilaceae bacterium]